ncbi:MAG: GNAT family N-acetyltransferase [Verrucomicrobia bacterium]|nr:GNAT family N-acetyltransferase [Verrucomicrobiota bacterium]
MARNSKTSRKGARESTAAVVIREMELPDLAPVFALGQRLFTAEKWPTLYRSWDQYELVHLFGTNGEYCLVAEAGDKVIGFALGSLMEKYRSPWRYGWLLWLGVDPRWKRHGVGRRLMRRLTDIFIEENARMILVDTDEANEDAIRFFRRAGFDNEIRHVYLSLNLDTHPKYIEHRESET